MGIERDFNETIAAAKSKAAQQKPGNPSIFLFEEDRSGVRMGKPGDSKNPYHADWFEYYTLDAFGNPHHEEEMYSLNFYSDGVPVSGGNYVGEAETIVSFRDRHPGHEVIVLSIEYSKKDLGERISDALAAYEQGSKSPVVIMPACDRKPKETCHCF